MFRYNREQKVCTIGDVMVGGQPGERAPLLIGNMFQKGDLILEDRKEGRFNRSIAEERIREVEQTSLQMGVPALIAMVANSEEEIKGYIDFFTSVTSMPFAIDIWQQKTRLAAARYVAEQSLHGRLLYNSITPWDDDIERQVSELRELGIRHVVVQVFDARDKRPAGRVTSLKRLLPVVEKGNFESILIDTAVMNLPATAFSILANRLIKEEYGLPVGFAPSNGTYMWRKNAGEQEKKSFPAIDAAVHAISALAGDFLFYGPLTGTARVFPAVAAATSMMAAAAYIEGSALPAASRHPLNLIFPDVVKQFEQEAVE
jgi:tetrahydromethanopterin S-methyltransferase subunit H